MATLKREWIWQGVKVLDYNFPDDQYYKNITKKNGIDLHHMASGESSSGDIDWWLSNTEKVATCVAVQRNGDISTMFNSDYWAHALGVKISQFDKFDIERIYKTKSNGKSYVANNEILNQNHIQCELDSWGRLTEINGKFYTWTEQEIDKSKVQFYPNGHKGYFYFEAYTPYQIESTRLLLIYWKKRYNIDISYKGDIIFNQNKRALSGEGGLWTHGAYRSDKDDLHPQPELIAMLKTL